MEDPHSVSSPRRIHSLSKKRRATVSSLDVDERAPGFGVSGEHGPKPSEVYGFVGSITTVVATGLLVVLFIYFPVHWCGISYNSIAGVVIFLAWAYVPEAWLHYIGIFYYPSRYWALAGPVYVMMTIVLALVFYVGLNFMSTPNPTSLNTMFDEFSREPSSFIPSMDGDDRPIEPISDIGINKINDLMFNNVN